ncbi:serine/threonine-protein kinase [Streptomyces sp. NPDC087422]|uniref:serine/threonine-protein kinase n=1 Tax=Streptomyces sp. NPDC087422 TaxID=3365786 RepID=UPI003822299E
MHGPNDTSGTSDTSASNGSNGSNGTATGADAKATRIGSYVVVRKLGEGGMGLVYLARSRGGRHVAVKVARPELAADPSFRERFRAEVAAARMVGGFHTAPVVDADPDAEAPWLATAYVQGPTLGQLLAARGPMGEEQLKALGAALAEALEAIHRCGLVHRDLKPGNIIMAEDGPRVLDFGISRAVENTRITTTGTSFGTPGFLAPEQAEGRDVDGAADIFALGAVLVAAAGGSAFGGGTPVALMYRSVHHEADVSAVPEAIRPMVAACLTKEPSHRPSTDQLLDWFGDSGTAEAGTGNALHRTGDAAPRTSDPRTPVPPPPPAAANPYASGVVPPPPPYAPGVPGPSIPPSNPPSTSLATAYPAHSPAPVPGVPAWSPEDDVPEFLAMDRKNALLADDYGISLGENGQTVDLPWPMIRFAECVVEDHESVFRMAVVLTNGTIRTGRVSSRSLAELTEWAMRFTLVRDRYLRQ